MRELVKKLSVIFVTLVFLVSGLTVASVASVQEGSLDESEFTRTVTLYRYGPDKSIRPVRVNIVLAKGQDLGEAIVEKCSELVENDAEMQDYIFGNVSQINISVLSRVRSWGKGFHWKSAIRIRIPFPLLLRYRIFTMLSDLPLRYKIFGINVIPRVYCNYSNDEKAWTEITTLPLPSRQDVNTTRVEGNHTIMIIGFIGYTGWRGMQAQWLDRLGKRTGFDGYAFLTVCKKLS